MNRMIKKNIYGIVASIMVVAGSINGSEHQRDFDRELEQRLTNLSEKSAANMASKDAAIAEYRQIIEMQRAALESVERKMVVLEECIEHMNNANQRMDNENGSLRAQNNLLKNKIKRMSQQAGASADEEWSMIEVEEQPIEEQPVVEERSFYNRWKMQTQDLLSTAKQKIDALRAGK